MDKVLIIDSCSQCKHASEGIRRCIYHNFLKDQFSCEFGSIPKKCPLPDAPLTNKFTQPNGTERCPTCGAFVWPDGKEFNYTP